MGLVDECGCRAPVLPWVKLGRGQPRPTCRVRIAHCNGYRQVRPGHSAVGSASAPSARRVRRWARSSGREVADRARIPATVLAAFNAAH